MGSPSMWARGSERMNAKTTPKFIPTPGPAGCGHMDGEPREGSASRREPRGLPASGIEGAARSHVPRKPGGEVGESQEPLEEDVEVVVVRGDRRNSR